MIKKILLVLIIGITPFLYQLNINSGSETYAQSTGDEIKDLQKQLEDVEENISRLQGEARTLGNEIEYLDTQIRYAELRIAESQIQRQQRERELEVLSDDIESLAVRADRLLRAVSNQERVLGERMREHYKVRRLSPIEVVFATNSLTEIVNTMKYFEVIEKLDVKLITQMEDTRGSYRAQQLLLEDKKRRVEEVKREIERQEQEATRLKAELAQQQESKRWLLDQTRNQELEYQKLVRQIQNEIASIQAALARLVDPDAEGTPVTKGQVIAAMGNTGCSTGPHLHFGVYEDGTARNPDGYLSGGKLDWPMSDYVITQGWGENVDWYRRHFGMSGHNGIDMWSPTGVITAAEDGVAYVAYDTQPCWLTGTIGKGIVIDHGDGLVTVYWHVQ